MGIDLSIVIPFRDEADNVCPVLWEIAAAFEGEPACEIVAVDDGSTDGTLEHLRRLRELGEGLPRLRVYSHARGCGQSAALLTGVRAAAGDWIATLDGDGQNDPADLRQLWQRARASATPAALYIGHRRVRHDNPVRRYSSRVANAVRGRLLGDHVPDTGCGVKLFRREVFLSLPYFDHIHRFLPALAHREGLTVESVPVRHRPRLFGRSKYGIRNRLWVGLVDLLGVMWLLRRRRLPGAVRELA